MATVGEITPFILGALKGEDDGRVALYHYFKNFYSPDVTVSPPLINDFFAECLQLRHWQERKPALYNDITDLIRRFFSSLNQPFRLDQLWDLNRTQIVNLEHTDTLCSIVKAHEDKLTVMGETIRVLVESEGKVISIRRTTLGEVIVRTYSPLARIDGAELFPLAPDQEIFYDAGMELKINALNKIKFNPTSQARFGVYPSQEGQLIYAQFVQGFAFRQNQSLKLHALAEEPRLFFSLKKLERIYINRTSDPYYLELISSLEKALGLLQNKAAGGLEFASQAFESGQIAFDQIFPDDKVLYSRLRELARWISSPAVRNQQPKPPEPEA
jgi:hypothetical protein